MYTENDNIFWRNYADKIGAEFIPRAYHHSPKIIKTYKGLNIIFDIYCHYSISGTRAYDGYCCRAYVNFDSNFEFRLKVTNTNMFHKLSSLFFGRKSPIDHGEFDRSFLLKTNNKNYSEQIFQDEIIKKILHSLKEVNLEISDKNGIWEGQLPKGKYALSYYRNGREIKPYQLDLIHQLFELILDKLIHLNLI